MKKNPTLRTRTTRRFTAHWRAATTLVRSYLLVVGGLLLLSAAAWSVAVPLGLFTAGVACFILEWRINE